MGHGGDIYRNQVELDFSVNLNPLGTPEAVARAVRESAELAAMYPDPRQEAVRRAIAQLESVSDDQVIGGSGASELLLAAVRALQPRRAFLFEPAFTGYAHVLEAAGCRIDRKILKSSDGFCLQEQDVSELFADFSADGRDAPGLRDLIILCDPANPTGRNIDENVLMTILEEAGKRGIPVLLDESFFLLSDKAEQEGRDRSGRLLRTCADLIIVRSLTKLFAIPGIRAGYAVASADNIRRIRAQLPEWNLSAAAEAAIDAGCRVLSETDFAAESRAFLREERGFLAGELAEAGMKVYPSDAPYLLFQGPEKLGDRLLARGILLRDCSDYAGLGAGWFRTAVKDHASDEALVRAVREVTG
ncbi:MAG: aminotransferase class I/II-fold pyridoxal phosphate-dependent enzyme [Lachnospiraceae bacterium]|nr:aminotransferase class I/II-fold pyridoxal phosphate-dependent enzyme [Lachnospiraceae bacterium]